MRSVVVYSGGLDSTVLLAHLLAEGREVHAFTVNYGQRHAREIESAKAVCRHYATPHQVADLRALGAVFGTNSLTDTAVSVAEGHYTEESMKTTVVPNRNMILLAVAAARAIALQADTLAYAAHGGDHAIYPDCRPEFADAMDHAIGLADWHKVRLERPMVSWTKTEIVLRGAALGVPMHLTWSCYKGGKNHCGRCGTCIERREAFHLAGVTDPTVYAPDAPSVAELVKSGWTL